MKRCLYILLLSLAGCSWFFKPPAPPSKEERTKQFISCFREVFNPTDEQLNTLKTKILTDDAMAGVAAEMERERDEMEKRMESDAQDEELLQRFHKVEELRSKMSEDHFRRMLALRSILTAEQRSKFLECKRRMGPPQLPHEG